MESSHPISNGILHRSSALTARAVALSALLLTGGCETLFEGLNQAVTIDYDHSLNFQSYRFEESVISEPDNEDWTTIVGLPNVGGQGVWMVYNICAFGNTAPDAQDFTYLLSSFFVEFQNQQFFYNPTMAAFTYENAQGLPATLGDIDEVGMQFREETQLGNDTDQVLAGTNFTAPTRIAIYVTFRGIVMNGVDLELPLRFGPTPPIPHIMEPRNQTPAKRDYNPVTMKTHLPTVCRPPRQ